jgi:hypothetical protein
MDESTHAASALFEEAVPWLHERYGQFEFWVKRDLVWAVQTRLRKLTTTASPCGVSRSSMMPCGPACSGGARVKLASRAEI